ncbi:hypothetical protein BDV23DRAFT_181592 [Aspergillus alliaceus]|uniref:Ricin B lectin domain-containing protein n=1 Tax=Petromyces alliaceus TaxID=209559 RepID=A0A5N7CF74_PETAA|nr:hypothetical protein BDV23DRAFT_181592 [Aspergillus alliaceus]
MALGNDVKTHPWENANCQRWLIESASDDYYGFRNMSTGKLLSVNWAGYVGASSWELREHEPFRVEGVGNGEETRLRVWWKEKMVWMVRPSMTDYLEFSGQVGYSSGVGVVCLEEKVGFGFAYESVGGCDGGGLDGCRLRYFEILG